MADKDRSKHLLSAEALPKVEVPKASEHKVRAFKLPASMQRGAMSSDQPKARVEPAAEEARAQDRAQRDEPAVPPERDQPALAGAEGERADSTLRFKDRTLGWFRTGDDLAEEEEADEYEAMPAERSRTVAWVMVVAVLVVGAAVAIWQLS